MNSEQLVGISLCFALSGSCLAAVPAVTQSVIEFRGSIVEPSCTSRANEHSKFELKGCPPSSYTTIVNVSRVDPINTARSPDQSNINVKLLAESGHDGRYYDQQYELMDAAGTPVQSGKYLITLTMP
jgi:type 1 fimbria pilin